MIHSYLRRRPICRLPAVEEVSDPVLFNSRWNRDEGALQVADVDALHGGTNDSRLQLRPD